MNKPVCISMCLVLVLKTSLAPSPAEGNLINDRTLITSEDVWHSSAALADLDGDGKLEVLVGSTGGSVYAWYHDGRLVDGWPQKASQRAVSSPAIADLDGDGYMEVVCVGHVWHHNGVPAAGWPQPANVFCTAALADIDLDGDLEVISGNPENGLDVRHHDGRMAEGWPQRTGAEMRITPAVGDIDGDGFPEIITYSMDQHLYAWNHDGTLLPGWPVATSGRVEAPPTLADLDGDGQLDYIVCERGIFRPDGKLTGQGTERPVPVDLNLDGELEIVGLRTAQSVGGQYLPGWPASVYSSHSDGVGVADIDGDADLEVLWSSRSNFLYAFNHDGRPASGWPRWLVEVGDTAPAIADIDDDGDLEVVVSTGIDRVFVWDEPSSRGPGKVAWPMFAGGPKRTGVPESSAATSYEPAQPLSPVQKHLAAGDFASAIEAYRNIAASAVSSPQQQAEAVLSIARIYNWRLQDDQNAFFEYAGFIEKFPESPLVPDAFLEMSDIFRYRFVGLQLREWFAGATEQFRRILEAGSEQSAKAKEWFLLGNAYEVQGDERQLAVFEKVANDYPDSYWAQISSLYLRYGGISHHVELEFHEDSIFRTIQKDIEQGELLAAERSMSLTIDPLSPAKQPFPCQVSVTTELKPVEIQGPKYPFPRDPYLLVSWDDRSKVSGWSRQRTLPNGQTIFTWNGALRSHHLHTGTRGGGEITTVCQTGQFVSDIAVERKYEKVGPRLQKCTIWVTSTWEPIVKVHRVAGIIDTMSPTPTPSSAIGDMIWWSGGHYRTEPEGVAETIEFSFVVELQPDVSYFYPEIWILPRNQKEQAPHPDMGKTLWAFECSFGTEAYQIDSTSRFKVVQMGSTVRRSYILDMTVAGSR